VKGNEQDERRLEGKGNKMKDKEKERNIRKTHYYSNVNLICILLENTALKQLTSS
jgi:hypothetical protein